MPDICVIIPCYNEYVRFPRKEFTDYYNSSNVSFCLVNDGSSDKTISLLYDIAKDKERVFVLNLENNLGKSEAIRYAANYLLENKDFDYIGYFDADLASPLKEIDNLFKHINGCQMVFGSRFKRLGARIERNALRHYLGRVFATLASLMLRLPIYDTQCGAKLMSSDFARIAFEKKFLTSWLFDIEIFFRLKNTDERYIDQMKEIPLEQWIEKGGSKIKFTHILKVPFQLLMVYFHYKE